MDLSSVKASVGPLLVYFDYLTAFTAHALNCPTSRSSEITSRLSNQSILMGGLLQLLLKICRFTFFLQTYLEVDVIAKLTRQPEVFHKERTSFTLASVY
ncbi:hypothetical protein Peur_027934 [Populus x canadensis]